LQKHHPTPTQYGDDEHLFLASLDGSLGDLSGTSGDLLDGLDNTNCDL